jgi:hypothetical protein
MKKKLASTSLMAACLLSACVTLPPPSVARLGDGVFVTTFPLRYSILDTKEVIVVPIGFLNDLASIPRILWLYESPIDRSMAGAIVHDYLYWDQRCAADEADAVLFLAMLESGVTKHKAYEIYWAVNSPFGKSAYAKNTRARARKEPRYLTEPYLRELQQTSTDPNATLASIQARAVKAGGIRAEDNSNPHLKQVCTAALELFKTKYYKPEPVSPEYSSFESLGAQQFPKL